MSTDLKTSWNNLFDVVMQYYGSASSSGCSGSSNSSCSSGVSSTFNSASANSDLQGENPDPEKVSQLTPDVCRAALIERGLRPRSEILNLLVDAVSFKFAELEREAESRVTSMEQSQSLSQYSNDTNANPEVRHQGKSDLLESTFVSGTAHGPPRKTRVQDIISTESADKSNVWVNCDVTASKSTRRKTSKKIAQHRQSTFDSLKGVVQNRYISTTKRNDPEDSNDIIKRHKHDTDLMKDFDKIPSRITPSNFKFREKPTRNKAERHKLPGWDCEDCRQYYQLLESRLGKVETAALKNKCSKHRSKSPILDNTPPGFWLTEIPSTEELYADGYINVASESFTPTCTTSHTDRKNN